MSIWTLKTAAVVMAAFSMTLVASAEKKIERSALPPAVEKTVQEQSKGATIKGFASETENGVFQYEVETMVNGHTKDISIAKDGTLLEVEEEVSIQPAHGGEECTDGEGAGCEDYQGGVADEEGQAGCV